MKPARENRTIAILILKLGFEPLRDWRLGEPPFKNMRRTLSLALASVVIAGPTLPSKDEAMTWAAGVESGSEPNPIPITAVGRDALGDETIPEGVNDLTADHLDTEAGVAVDAYHQLLGVEETSDGWRAIIQADILAAPPLRELDQGATDTVLVAVSGFSSPEEAREWFGHIGEHERRFFPDFVSIGLVRVTDSNSSEDYYSDESEVDLNNGVTTFGVVDDLAWLGPVEERGEEGGWGIIFVAAGIRYAIRVPATGTTTTAGQNYHERGVISSPVLADESTAQNWLEDLRNGNVATFVPQLVGRAAVEALGNDTPELGEFNHLPHNVDWASPIRVTEVNEHYGTVPFEGGFVVVVNADFTYTAKVAVGAAD